MAVYALAALGGLVGGLAGLCVLEPQTRLEALRRVAFAVAASLCLSGVTAAMLPERMRTAGEVHTTLASGFCQGAFAYFVFSWVFRWIEKRRERDIAEIADELRRVRDGR